MKKKFMKKLALHWKILIGMFLGVLWALFSGAVGLNEFTVNWIDPFGIIFINCLKFIAIPLVLFSIVGGVAGLGDVRQLGRIGAKTLGLYLLTTIASVTLGLTLVNLFEPGKNTLEDTNRLRYEIWAESEGIEVMDGKNLLINADPEIVKKITASLDEERSSSDYQKMMSKSESAGKRKTGPLQPLVDMVPENLIAAFSSSKLMLQVIFFALFFGIALSLMQSEGSKQVHLFFNAMGDVFIKMVNMIMALSPFFVFCLMAGVLAKIADSPSELFTLFQSLGLYALVVVLGLALLLFAFYPLLQRLFGVKFGYREFYNKMSPAQFLAFSTSSSAATLPVTIRCVQEGLKVPKKVSDFVLPIGATVNMDGTSLYQAVAVIFLAQFHGVDLSITQQLGIVATTTLASIGSAAVPSAGLIMLMFVLNSVGLNPMWIVIIYPIDRILDMCRTVINVTSDATVAAIVAKSEK
ncbi:MAG: dicarboxylate/amino acid:cation symporter [Crocinitomicaceae bacterium]|tara:strand:- start:13132 stop:14529 length:1398 start_codon:yes stop_codon:yes gene_type:complete